MLLNKKLPHQLFSLFNPLFHRRRLLLDVRHRSSTAAVVARRNPSSTPSAAATTTATAAESQFLIRYLIDSCRFSKSKATEVSKPDLTRINSTEKPAAVISYLKDQGFTKDHVRPAISGEPSVLCVNVSEALEPKIRALKDAGFSGSEIPKLFSTRPRAFRVSALDDKVRFWAKCNISGSGSSDGDGDGTIPTDKGAEELMRKRYQQLALPPA